MGLNQRQMLLDLFRRNGRRVTLAQITEVKELRSEYRRLVCELRDEGFGVSIKQNGKERSLNIYTLTEKFIFQSGQGQLFAAPSVEVNPWNG